MNRHPNIAFFGGTVVIAIMVMAAIQIAPIAQQARNFNTCVQQGVERNRKDSKDPNTPQLRALSVAFCNGEGRAPRPPLPQVEGDVFF